MPRFLGFQCWSFDDKTHFPGAKAKPTLYVGGLFLFFLETLMKCIPDLFNVLNSFFTVTWEAVFWAIVLSLVQIKWGDTCTPMADSCQCMAKTTTIL